jgi:hypothetical protein
MIFEKFSKTAIKLLVSNPVCRSVDFNLINKTGDGTCIRSAGRSGRETGKRDRKTGKRERENM